MQSDVVEFDIDLEAGGSVKENTVDEDALTIDNFEDSDVADSPTAISPYGGYGGAAGQLSFPVSEFSDLEPYEGMEFESEEAAKASYNAYARRTGFSTRVSSSRRAKRDGAIVQRQFVCAKEGFRNVNEKRMKDREIKRPRVVTRVGCKASLSVKALDSGRWVVSGFVKEHNHELVSPDQVHCLRSHRQISGAAKTLIDTLQAAGLGPRRIMSALIKEYGGISKVGFTEVDCRNYMRNNRFRSLEADVQVLIRYLRRMREEHHDFFYAVQGNEDHCTGNVFWADARTGSNYRYLGDTVTFDTTYRSNRYRLPFAAFTGLNHHGQPVLFGCAFVMSETEASFVWLFRTWLAAMGGRHPVSITTDYDPVIGTAIAEVFPNSRHRFCKWHIFKQCQDKLSQVFLQHPSFELDFHKCINSSETTVEFDSNWFSLMDGYCLEDNEWLSALYTARGNWVPVYLRDTFFAEMSSTQRSDCMNSYFDGYINASTNPNQFISLYEKALGSRNMKEIKADYETLTSCPDLKTPSPMEKQASEIYTKRLFMRFQEELVGTLTFMAAEEEEEDAGDIISYRVSKFGEEQRSYSVSFNVMEMKANCSCQMFEFSGIICRHILAVFRVTNVLSLPPFYILKRWTRNAKSNVTLDQHKSDVCLNYLDSHTVRHITLRHEAVRFVDEASKSVESFNMAAAAMEEASETLSLATKCSNKEEHVTESDASDEPVACNNGVNLMRCSSLQPPKVDDMDEKIEELSKELEAAKKKCECYRSNLLTVLNAMEDHKLHLSVKVEHMKIALRDVCS